ncbi:MAG: M28 family metallopeptidase [Parvicellaceae bacterium]
MIKYLLILFFIINNNGYLAQKNSFKYYVDTLSSDSFFGRGYVNQGHTKAANYIANEFAEIGLKPKNGNQFFQKFNIDVNTFPGKVEVTLSNKKLNPGIDFIVDPSSGSAKGTYELINVNLQNWKSVIKNENFISTKKAFLLDISDVLDRDTLAMYRELKFRLAQLAPLVLLTNEKLTWSLSNFEINFPLLVINKSIFDTNQKSIDLNIENEFKKSLISQNVIGFLSGKKSKYIIISAHYDHLGMMGSAIFPGANDNASGVSLLMNLAKYYHNKNTKYNMLFICFGAEEIGLLGSKFFNEFPLIKMSKIKLVLNLDIVGTGIEGIALVNALEQKKYAKKIGAINKEISAFEKVKIRGQAPNSDHYWFSVNNVPSIFLYTLGGIKAYHDPLDKAQTLPLNKIYSLMNLITRFLKEV